MKIKFLIWFLFLTHFGFSQQDYKPKLLREDSKITYIKFDFSVPIKANQYAGEIDPYTGETGYWFLPD